MASWRRHAPSKKNSTYQVLKLLANRNAGSVLPHFRKYFERNLKFQICKCGFYRKIVRLNLLSYQLSQIETKKLSGLYYTQLFVANLQLLGVAAL